MCTYIGSTWCVLPLQPYRDITSVLFCRLINVDILLLFSTMFIRYKTEIHDNRRIYDAIYVHMFKFIYRSYRYTSWTFNSFIHNNRDLAVLLRRWTFNLEAVPCFKNGGEVNRLMEWAPALKANYELL